MAIGFLLLCGVAVADDAKPVVTLETSMGNIKIELYPDKAPETVKNFLKYVEKKHYDGTIFHRVMGKENYQSDFMIQGGGFQPGLKEKSTDAPIKNEAASGLKNERGTVAMARTGDPNSATAQFFINVGDNVFLNRQNDTPRGAGYCAFGKVIEGMDVVDKIKAVKTRTVVPGQFENVPVEDIVIRKAVRTFLALAASADEPVWKMFASKEQRFTVSFPGEPKQEDLKPDSEKVIQHVRFVVNRDGIHYGGNCTVGAKEIADKLNALDPSDLAKQSKENTIKGTEGEILSQKDITLGNEKRPGYELLIKNSPNFFMRLRVFYANGTLYQLMVAGPSQDADTAASADKFLDSFRLSE